MSDSQWQFDGNPLSCKLTHKVPLYGNAEFQKQAGSKESLYFRLAYKRQPVTAVKTAKVRAISPSWQPQQPSRELGQLNINQGEHIFRSTDNATWRLLNELETGRYPTFYYQQFNQREDQVAVSLSSIGFQTPYSNFLDCLTKLVPYELDELSKMTLYFDFDKSGVRAAYRDKLKALSQYIKYDSNVEVVLVNGYTDSRGPRYYNQKLAQKRIDSVKQLLQMEGVSDERFITNAYGEKKPAATNRTESGRALNRRVFIQLAQK